MRHGVNPVLALSHKDFLEPVFRPSLLSHSPTLITTYFSSRQGLHEVPVLSWHRHIQDWIKTFTEAGKIIVPIVMSTPKLQNGKIPTYVHAGIKTTSTKFCDYRSLSELDLFFFCAFALLCRNPHFSLQVWWYFSTGSLFPQRVLGDLL